MASAAGCIFVARSTGRIMLAMRSSGVSQPNCWSGFGGAVDSGETDEQAVRREMAEEAGFQGVCSLHPVHLHEEPGFSYQNYVAIVTDEFDASLNWENDQARWFDPDRLPEPLHPGIDICLRKQPTIDILRSCRSQSLTEAHRPEQPPKGEVDPSLLTYEEYRALVLRGSSKVSHPSDAYETTVDNLSFHKMADYPHLLRQIKKNGLRFSIRMRKEKLSYVKRGPDKEFLRDDQNNLIYYTDDEVQTLGMKPYDYSFAVFNEDEQAVCTFGDEWGCVLIRTAREYEGFGFGTLLTKIGRTVYPDKPAGGFTPSGGKNFQRVHRAFVSDALKNGSYSRLVRAGEMSIERVKQIVQSAHIDHSVPRGDRIDLSTKPSDWLLHADGYGSFIIYDQKLPTLLDDNRFEYFAEKMIIGLLYVAPGEKYGIIHAYGGDSLPVKRLLLRCGLEFCRRHGVDMLVDEQDLDDLDPETMLADDPGLASGAKRSVVKSRKRFTYDGLVDQEKSFRGQFDRFEEFRYRLIEMAYAKFRPT